jgi:hypothetical protein
MKKKITVFALLAGIFFSCNDAATTATSKTEGGDSTKIKTDGTGNGWVSLFDGKTTTGWHSYGKSSVDQFWKITDGAIYLDTTKKEGGGDLVTDKEYGNFDLKLEWKIAKNGNSGIIFFVHEDTAQFKATYHTGPEMQVLDNDGHPDGKLIKHRAGDLYDLISCTKETVKPVGEWNEVEITSKDGKLDFFLNGTNVVSTTMWDDNWKKLVAGSKFKDMPGFSTFKKGKIALQDHGNMVWYRNIQIKEL